MSSAIMSSSAVSLLPSGLLQPEAQSTSPTFLSLLESLPVPQSPAQAPLSKPIPTSRLQHEKPIPTSAPKQPEALNPAASVSSVPKTQWKRFSNPSRATYGRSAESLQQEAAAAAHPIPAADPKPSAAATTCRGALPVKPMPPIPPTSTPEALRTSILGGARFGGTPQEPKA